MLKDRYSYIDDRTQYAIIDLILVDEETELYSPLFRFVNINPMTNEEGGVAMKTGMVACGLADISKLISDLIRNGLFLQKVSAHGTIYNLDQDIVGTVNWNHLDALIQLEPTTITPMH